MNDFLTWAFLGTFAGAVLITSLITQLVKGVSRIDRIPTQLVSWAVAAVVLLVSTAAAGGLVQPWETWAIIPLNAAVVSLGANGAYAGARRILCGRETPPGGPQG